MLIAMGLGLSPRSIISLRERVALSANFVSLVAAFLALCSSSASSCSAATNETNHLSIDTFVMANYIGIPVLSTSFLIRHITLFSSL